MAWYDDEHLLPEPTTVLNTPLGKLRIEPGGVDGYEVYCEMVEPVKINNVLYIIQGTFRLDPHREEWVGGLSPRRCFIVAKTPHNKGWEIVRGDCSATVSAQNRVRSIYPTIRTWVEDHFAFVMNGRTAKLANMIRRGHARLDDALKKIEERRAELQRMQAHLDATGGLEQKDRDLLQDIWGYHWKF